MFKVNFASNQGYVLSPEQWFNMLNTFGFYQAYSTVYNTTYTIKHNVAIDICIQPVYMLSRYDHIIVDLSKTAVTPWLTHWSYYCLASSHRYNTYHTCRPNTQVQATTPLDASCGNTLSRRFGICLREYSAQTNLWTTLNICWVSAVYIRGTICNLL